MESSKKFSIYILVPAHNNKSEVLELLGCLDKQTYRDFQIVLVDDGSTDGTGQDVRRFFPAVEIIRGDGRLWWTGANVIGVKHIMKNATTDDYVLLLNNDLVIDNDYIEIMVRASRQFKRALIGSLTIDYADNKNLIAGVKLAPDLSITINKNKDLIEAEEYDTTVDVLTGRGTLVPISAYRELGLYNRKKLPHYGADYEFSIRAKRAGYQLVMAHRARVYAKLDITGLDVPQQRALSLSECFMLLFSKKSKTNVIYYLNYIWLCSEKQYRIANVLRSCVGTLFRTFGRTRLLFPFNRFLTQVAARLIGRMPAEWGNSRRDNQL